MEKPIQLKVQVHPELSARCLQGTIDLGKEGAFVGPQGNKNFPWKVLNFRRPQLDASLQKVFTEMQREPDFWLRHRTDLNWQWQTHELPIQELIEPVLPYYKVLTRVASLVLKPGESVPPHRDRVDGNLYEDGRLTLNANVSHTNSFHKDNQYLALKIPLIFSAEKYGRPYLVKGEQRNYYNFSYSCYAIDEYTVQHGVEPVDYWRGVIVMDGILNLEKVYADALP